MVKIRLTRIGKKNDPFYRIVAIDEQRKNRGKALEVIGYWHPKKDLVNINKEKLNKWLKNGAVLSAAVSKLISNEKTT